MTVDPAAARLAMNAVRGIPRDREGPVFREPWEAQAFAMAVALHARGLFTWKEWAATLGEEIKRAQAAGDPDTGETYYRHWLATLERMVAMKGLAIRRRSPATTMPGTAPPSGRRTARRSNCGLRIFRIRIQIGNEGRDQSTIRSRRRRISRITTLLS